jgi:SAM-dependent methyltransferase
VLHDDGFVDRGIDADGNVKDRSTRARVGPPQNFDLMAGLQFSLLFALGLREHHQLCDVGCGSLRAGRLLIPYMAPGHYCGIEPYRDLVDRGIAEEIGADTIALKQPRFVYDNDFPLEDFGVRFDFVFAQSILSHCRADLTSRLFSNVAENLAQGGVFVGTFFERRPWLGTNLQRPRGIEGAGWVESLGVAYTWRELRALAAARGLVLRRLRFPHPAQRWFVAVPERERDRLRALERAASGWASQRRAVRKATPLRSRNQRAFVWRARARRALRLGRSG